MFAVRASAAAALKNVAAAAANAQRNVVAASATRAASTIAADNRFMARLDSGDTIICAEGYLFEMERRGYVQIGPFVPTVVMDHPDAVEGLHREFLRAGSDIIEAFTYYGHREKLKLIGKEELLEPLNKQALDIAKKVAAEGDALVAGNVCNTTVWDLDKDNQETCRLMFREQCEWAAEAGVDLIIGETFDYIGEALCATEEIQRVGLPSVITMAVHSNTDTRDGHTMVDGMKALADAGATVVGMNCARGPATMLPCLKDIKAALPNTPLAALPVGYTTNEENPTMQSFSDWDKKYCELDHHTCTRYEFAEFAIAARDLGVQYLGVCCGGAPHHVRAMAEALGRHPPSSDNSPNLALHFSFGDASASDRLKKDNLDYKQW